MLLRKFKCWVTVIILSVLLTSADASELLKSAIGEHLKDVSVSKGGEALKHQKQHVEDVKKLEKGLDDSSSVEHSNLKDEAKYLKKNLNTKGHEKSDAFEGSNFEEDKNQDTKSVGFKKGHKKGHHNQGFHNSYNKEESSNKSSFYDDFNDEGDQAQYINRHNAHDNKGGRKYHGAMRDGGELANNEYSAGGYSKYGDKGNKHAAHRDYGNQYYKQDRSDYDKHRMGQNGYNRGRHYERETPVYSHGYGHGWVPEHPPPPPPPPPPPLDPGYNDWGYERPGYNDWSYDKGYGGGYDAYGGYAGGYPGGYPGDYIDESRDLPVKAPQVEAPQLEAPLAEAPVPDRRQTITIYEDPRYDGTSARDAPQDSNQAIQLEVRPSRQRYASYNDVYYSPRNDEVVESSKINRLVYNYNRRH